MRKGYSSHTKGQYYLKLMIVEMKTETPDYLNGELCCYEWIDGWMHSVLGDTAKMHPL